MGVNMPESVGEGDAFASSLAFFDKDKPTEKRLEPMPESTGEEYKKYLSDICPEIITDNIDPNMAKDLMGDLKKISDTYNVPIIIGHQTTGRPSKVDYYLKMAEDASLRGTCIRRRFGAVIVKNDEIISTGYVGAPRGRQNCIDMGYCWRQEHNIPSGQMYEKCRSVHAEMNAIISAERSEMIGSTMYLVGIENDGEYTEANCCAMCKRVIINAGISKVVFRRKDGSIRTVDVQEWIDNDDSLIEHEGY